MNRFAVVAIALLLATPLSAADSVSLRNSEIAATDGIANTFFSLVRDGKISEAYAGMLNGKLFAEKKQEVDNLASETQTMVKLYGVVNGWERIQTTYISPDYMSVFFEVRTANLPVFFNIKFYRPTDGGKWVANYIIFTDDNSKFSDLKPVD